MAEFCPRPHRCAGTNAGFGPNVSGNDSPLTFSCLNEMRQRAVTQLGSTHNWWPEVGGSRLSAGVRDRERYPGIRECIGSACRLIDTVCVTQVAA